MIKVLKNIYYSLLTSRTMRFLSLTFMVFLLSGCENDGDTSLGADGNIENQSACWQTQITDAVTQIVNQLYQDSSDKVRQGGGNLMLVAFAVWMGFKLLKVLASFKEESLGEVWTEIMQKMFLVAFCAYFIFTDTIDDALNIFVIPIYQTVIELGLRGLLEDGGGTIIHMEDFALGDFGQIDFTHDVESCPVEASFGVVNGDLRAPIRQVSNCLICEISNRLNAGINVGIALIVSGRIYAVLLGLLMMVLFIAAKFGFALYLIDALFRLNFAVFLIPVLLMGVPFNYTRKWSKHGFLMFINSSGIMMMMAVLTNIVIMTLEEILRRYEDAFTFNSIESLNEPLLAMLLISLLLINVPGLAVTISNTFIGGGNGMEFHEKISKFIINSIKKTGGAMIGALTQGATNAVTGVLEKYETTRQTVDAVKKANTKVTNALNSLAGYNDDGD